MLGCSAIHRSNKTFGVFTRWPSFIIVHNKITGKLQEKTAWGSHLKKMETHINLIPFINISHMTNIPRSLLVGVYIYSRFMKSRKFRPAVQNDMRNRLDSRYIVSDFHDILSRLDMSFHVTNWHHVKDMDMPRDHFLPYKSYHLYSQ